MRQRRTKLILTRLRILLHKTRLRQRPQNPMRSRLRQTNLTRDLNHPHTTRRPRKQPTKSSPPAQSTESTSPRDRSCRADPAARAASDPLSCRYPSPHGPPPPMQPTPKHNDLHVSNNTRRGHQRRCRGRSEPHRSIVDRISVDALRRVTMRRPPRGLTVRSRPGQGQPSLCSCQPDGVLAGAPLPNRP